MDKILYDVEVFKNCFLCSIKDYETKKVITWEISSDRNDFEQFKQFFYTYEKYLISFNGIHYDNCIVLYLLDNFNDKNILKSLKQLKDWSDYIINTEDLWWKEKRLSKYKYHNKWIDVDLYLYWSKMLRISKKISLKGLAVQLNYPVIQELPFDPSLELNSEQIAILKKYNSVHDLGILELLTSKMKDDINLRVYIKKEYNLPCMSYDAPKIASELLLQDYCNKTGKDIRETRNLRFTYKSKLELPKIKFKLKEFEQVYEEMKLATTEYSREIVVIKNNTSIKLTYGKGGLHSVNSNECYKEDSNNYIVTSDVGSLYPNKIINYKLFRFKEVLDVYSTVKSDRMIAKKNKDKSKDALLKLILNSTSGLIDNEHSWLYYPEGAMKLRLSGQLVLTKTIEELILNDYKVISANTDGIEVIVPKNKLNKYYEIVDTVGNSFNLTFEHERYKFINYLNVNSYIAETINGKIKQKNLFVESPELGNSVDFLIIPKTLKAYYIDNIPVKDFVTNHKVITDFCCSMKVDKSYEVIWMNNKQQRLNRFYASTKGGYIYKKRNGKLHHMLKDSGVTILNNLENNFPNDINYSFYIKEINNIINNLNNNNQLELF